MYRLYFYFHRAGFYLAYFPNNSKSDLFQYMDAAIETFNSIAEKDNFVIDYSLADSISTYLEKWRMKLWDIGFTDMFKRSGFKKKVTFSLNTLMHRSWSIVSFIGSYSKFTNSLSLQLFIIVDDDYMYLIMLISRRYFMLELIPKKAISKEDLPPFLYSWSDLFSPTCMFNSYQMKTWTSAHLRGAGWYLECGPKTHTRG